MVWEDRMVPFSLSLSLSLSRSVPAPCNVHVEAALRFGLCQRSGLVAPAHLTPSCLSAKAESQLPGLLPVCKVQSTNVSMRPKVQQGLKS